MDKKIRTIFIGTPDFAVPSLRSLVADPDFQVLGVVTQPDKKVGRKQVLTPSPVKAAAEEMGLPVWQPASVKKFAPTSQVDVIVVVAYSQIIPENLLDYPRYGAVNVHGSLLPRYRGAACIQAAVEHGDRETGITIMKMDKGLDTGPILAQYKVPIAADDTAGMLFEKLSETGAKVLIPALKRYIKGEIKPQAQDDSLSSYVGMLKKDDGRINWTLDAARIESFIRSRLPWPGAWSKIRVDGNEKIVKINSVGHSPVAANDHRLGELFMHGDELAIQCGRDALIIRKLQLEGKKEASAEDFLRGHKEFIGQVLI